jgi:hypothetical protein
MQPLVVSFEIDVDRNVVKDHLSEVWNANLSEVERPHSSEREEYQYLWFMRFFARTLVFGVYLMATTGIYVHMHYCGGDLANVGLFGTCGHDCCDDTEASECCDSENIYISLEDEHRVVSSTAAPTQVVLEIASQEITCDETEVKQDLPENPAKANAPPDRAYLRYQRLVYYA